MKLRTGERIKLTRKEKHISAEELAAAANISPATMYRYENGDTAEIPADKVEAIAKALHTTAHYLTGKLKKDLHALDIEIKDRGTAGIELVDKGNPELSVRYTRSYWMRLQERNDFKTVWHDLHKNEEKLAPEVRDELVELTALFRSLTPEQKEQAKNFLRFLKGSGGTK